ncbi:MAG: hypothetical protein U1D55_07395 [Phycisphaerae bacterium]
MDHNLKTDVKKGIRPMARRFRGPDYEPLDPEEFADPIDALIAKEHHSNAQMLNNIDAAPAEAGNGALSLNRTRPPDTFRDAVLYVAAYLERHPTTGYRRLADGRPCFLAQALEQLRKWLDGAPRGAEQSPAEQRGEGWSL